MFFVRQRGAKGREVHAAETTFGLPVGYTRGDVEVAFRRLARKAHPDAGGSSEAFHAVVVQREVLLSDLLVREYSDTASDAARQCQRMPIAFVVANHLAVGLPTHLQHGAAP